MPTGDGLDLARITRCFRLVSPERLLKLCRLGEVVVSWIHFVVEGPLHSSRKQLDRASLGIDLNPAAWVFAKVKTDPETNVEQLLYRLEEIKKEVSAEDRKAQNEFQEWAWCEEVLGFLNAARRVLDWRENKTDRTLMGFILAHLHANHKSGLSNQLQNSRSMGPEYAVRWWKSRR